MMIAVAALLAVGRPMAESGDAGTAQRPGQPDAGLHHALGLHVILQYLIIWSGNLPEEIPWYLRGRAAAGSGWPWP